MELKRCSEDPVYFAQKYALIEHPLHGSVPFVMHDYQIEMMRAFQENRLNICLLPRQAGKTIVTAVFLLWEASFFPNKTILIVSNDNDNAMEIIYRIQYTYEELPVWLKPGVTDAGWNKKSVRFDNKSRILSSATTPKSGRGKSASRVFIDEFAHVPHNIQERFWTSMLPTLTTGGSCIIASTPNGDSDLFAVMWRASTMGNTNVDGMDVTLFNPIFVNWRDIPGRDENYKRTQIGLLGEQKFRQEIECEFISSDALLISSIILTNLTQMVNSAKVVATFRDVTFWKKIVPNGTYVIGVDPGTGSGSDYSVINVVEFPSMVQVAEYRTNSLSSPHLYNVLKNIINFLEDFNATIYYSVENNGVGEGIISLIQVDENPPKTAEFVSEENSKRLGFTTTDVSKMAACLTLKEMVEKDGLLINSSMLLKELKSFVKRGTSYKAQIGSTDDCISSMLIVMRIIKEMSSFEQEAYRKVYAFEDDEWDFSGVIKDEYDEDDDSKLNNYDDDIPPFII